MFFPFLGDLEKNTLRESNNTIPSLVPSLSSIELLPERDSNKRFPKGSVGQGLTRLSIHCTRCTGGRNSHKLHSGREGRGRTEGWVLVYQGILQTSFLLRNTLENTEPLLQIHTHKFLKRTLRVSCYCKIESVHRTLLSLTSTGVAVAEASDFPLI